LISLRKRGKGYHADLVIGKVHAARGSLATRNQDAARRSIHKLETALAEGPFSPLWQELKMILPASTYKRFSDIAGVKDPHFPTWADLHTAFNTFMEQRIVIGKLAPSTAGRYKQTCREFGAFLALERVSLLKDISRPLVESFKVWRVQQIKQKKFARGATGLVLEAAILHRIFSFAIENDMVLKNPVRMEGRPGENPQGGAEPFTASELSRMRAETGDDLLAFLLLRWTGLRGSDAVTLEWMEVRFDHREIERITQKRRKKVILPIHAELLFALEVEYQRRTPEPTHRVLLNPTTAAPMMRPRLYQRMLALGKRAGVNNAHPHRFRDTLAVDMLSRGASPYDVAKMLGDSIDTIERHYTSFVKELRERVRYILETGVGIEESAKTGSESSQNVQRKPN
jgi:integrase